MAWPALKVDSDLERHGVRQWLNDWLHTPPERDVEGKPRGDGEQGTARSHYWARWRGSVRRIADLALTLQEVTGIEASKPIRVRWSRNLAIRYSPADFRSASKRSASPRRSSSSSR